jgi:hypothetical protein
VSEDGILNSKWEVEQQQQRQQPAGVVVSIQSTSAAAAAAAAARQAHTAAAVVQPELNSSSSSSQSVRWQHLLCLYRSRKLAVAFCNFRAAWSEDRTCSVLSSIQPDPDAVSKGQSMEEVLAAVLGKLSLEQLVEMRQLYQNALCVCRTVTALAPLPVVCNNPGCGELSGVSEVSAAHYMCAGCGCRYCSAACQAAGWRSHEKACRLMAAHGLSVEGR